MNQGLRVTSYLYRDDRILLKHSGFLDSPIETEEEPIHVGHFGIWNVPHRGDLWRYPVTVRSSPGPDLICFLWQ
jgi:hypothetical protein